MKRYSLIKNRVYLDKTSGKKVFIKPAHNTEVEFSKCHSGYPFIVEVTDQFYEGRQGYIVQELCEESLLQHLKANPGLQRDDKLSYILQMAMGVLFINREGFAHRDIKLDNALMKGGRVKLCDMGESKRISKAQTKEVGNLVYAAPETRSLENNRYNEKVDVWSLSCAVLNCLFEKVFNDYSFLLGSKGSKEAHEKLLNEILKLTQTDLLIGDLLSRGLCLNPSRRMNILEFVFHPAFERAHRKVPDVKEYFMKLVPFQAPHSKVQLATSGTSGVPCSLSTDPYVRLKSFRSQCFLYRSLGLYLQSIGHNQVIAHLCFKRCLQRLAGKLLECLQKHFFSWKFQQPPSEKPNYVLFYTLHWQDLLNLLKADIRVLLRDFVNPSYLHVAPVVSQAGMKMVPRDINHFPQDLFVNFLDELRNACRQGKFKKVLPPEAVNETLDQLIETIRAFEADPSAIDNEYIHEEFLKLCGAV